VSTPGSVDPGLSPAPGDISDQSSHAAHTVPADRIFGQILGILEERAADVGSAPSPFTSPFTAQCLTALAHFKSCTKHLVRRLEVQTAETVKGPLDTLLSSKKTAESEDPAVRAMHEPRFRDGLLDDIRARLADVTADRQANGSRLRALLLITTVLSENGATDLGKILKPMGVKPNVCENEWAPARMRTAISLLHPNTLLRKQLTSHTIYIKSENYF
jgi:hypothetical protein